MPYWTKFERSPLWLKDLLTAVSLSNLCFYGAWSNLWSHQSLLDQFMMKRPAEPSDFAAVMLDILIVSLLLWGAMYLARRCRRVSAMSFARWAFLLALFIPLYAIMSRDPASSLKHAQIKIGKIPLVIYCSLIAGTAIYGLARWHSIILRAARISVLLLFPFIAVTFGRGLGEILVRREAGIFDDKNRASPYPALLTPQRRVLIMIFDELDQRLLFDERPTGMRLPEFDRFHTQALVANNAFPPSNSSTLISLPAIITGHLVSESHPVHPAEMMLKYTPSADEVPWSKQESLFSVARKLKVNSAIVGWAIPYGRMFGDQVVFCSWLPHVSQMDGRPMTLLQKMVERLWTLTPLRTRHQHMESYRSILADAKKAAANPSYELVFIHWPVPHAPNIYNRRKQRFTLFADPVAGYLDNLALADWSLGEIRRAMQAAGVWDRTSILITGDHAWRYSWDFDHKLGHKVPLMLKLAGESKSLSYDSAFNTVLIHDLAIALLRDELPQPENVADWLDRERSRFMPAERIF